MKKIKRFKEKLPFRKKVTKSSRSSAVSDQNLAKRSNASLIQSLPEESVTKEEEITSNIKNILLIGRTGNGKSTLANVLTGTADQAYLQTGYGI
jgi:predicted GTPase